MSGLWGAFLEVFQVGLFLAVKFPVELGDKKFVVGIKWCMIRNCGRAHFSTSLALG